MPKASRTRLLAYKLLTQVIILLGVVRDKVMAERIQPNRKGNIIEPLPPTEHPLESLEHPREELRRMWRAIWPWHRSKGK